MLRLLAKSRTSGRACARGRSALDALQAATLPAPRRRERRPSGPMTAETLAAIGNRLDLWAGTGREPPNSAAGASVDAFAPRGGGAGGPSSAASLWPRDFVAAQAGGNQRSFGRARSSSAGAQAGDDSRRDGPAGSRIYENVDEQPLGTTPWQRQAEPQASTANAHAATLWLQDRFVTLNLGSDDRATSR